MAFVVLDLVIWEVMQLVKMTHQEWAAEAVRRFGPNAKDWKFVCPVCGYVQSMRDFETQTDLSLEEIERVIGFSCIGRWMEHLDESAEKSCFERDRVVAGGPCNYAGGGLFKLNPMRIEKDDEVHQLFAFAEATLQELPSVV